MSSKQGIDSTQAATILREVPPEQAFKFYSAVDAPLGMSARSLGEFVERVKAVEPASLAFHVQRQDFEKWVSMLGDADLAKKIGKMRSARLEGEALRAKLYNVAKGRVDQLNRLALKIPR
jgi:alpha-amylase